RAVPREAAPAARIPDFALISASCGGAEPCGGGREGAARASGQLERVPELPRQIARRVDDGPHDADLELVAVEPERRARDRERRHPPTRAVTHSPPPHHPPP